MVKRSRSRSLSSSSDQDASSPIPRDNNSASHPNKLPTLSSDTPTTEKHPAMKCYLPPHAPLSFPTYTAYETHYNQSHINRCHTCNANFPTDHFLSLHIAEHHDPITAARQARGDKVYACLVPDCDRVCSTPQKRRLHCIDKHHFPKSYDFFIVKEGIEGRNWMLRPHRRTRSGSTASATTESEVTGTERTKSKGAGGAMESVEEEGVERQAIATEAKTMGVVANHSIPNPVTGQGAANEPSKSKLLDSAAEDPMEDLTSEIAALKFVPSSVRFGRGRGRGGLVKDRR